MRFPAALLFCFSVSLLWMSCDKDDDIVCCFPVTTIDCSTINTFDTAGCTVLNTFDSVAYVNSFLGSWYLAATQSSGFGGGSTDCINYTETESPLRFTFNDDYTWRYISNGANPIDTLLGWRAFSGFGGWLVGSTDSNYPFPSLTHDCDGNLVVDSRPLDGDLTVFVKVD